MPRRQAGGGAGLAGRRVLVVADAFLIAALIERILTGWGCTIIGPVARAEEALDQVENGAPDVALLDIDLRGRAAARLVAALRARGVPLLLVTGYGRTAGVGPVCRGVPRIDKPFDAEELVHAVARTVRARG